MILNDDLRKSMKKYIVYIFILSLFFNGICIASEVKSSNRYPGTSIASALLQKDASIAVFSAAGLKVKNCTDFSVTDTLLQTKPEFNKIYNGYRYASTPWFEEWTVNACGKNVFVPIMFIPDDDGLGTSFAVSADNVRLK